MGELPIGTVTFLLTDVEGSTRLWERDPGAMARALARHDALLPAVIRKHGGMVLKQRGEGDSLFAVFTRARGALDAALALQLAMVAEPWPAEAVLRVRVALHTGETEVRAGDYYGPAVNRCARIRELAQGGQILLSRTTYEVVRDHLPPEASLQSLGPQPLADMQRPEEVFQLQHRRLAVHPPGARPSIRVPHNLPVPMTSFVGRGAEVAAVRQRLLSARLLTLVGEGGSGKTRLALEAARGLLPSFRHGAWQVALAGLTDPDLLAPAVATAVGAREQRQRDPRESLADYLCERSLLLVLDHCDAFTDALGPLGAELLAVAPGVCILATSRSALGVSDEQVHEVGPLAVSAPRARDSADRGGLPDAVQLFVDRANAGGPALVTTGDAIRVAGDICRLLGGNPLAIELAAARTGSLGLADLHAGLEAHVTSTDADRLQGVVKWSVGLLDAQGRLLLHRLGAFAGGFTEHAAGVVCASEGISAEAMPLLIRQLREAALLERYESPGGVTRFRLSETARAFALRELAESAVFTSLRDRHAYFFLGLSQEAEQGLAGPLQAAWLERLDDESSNLRAALDWLAERGEAVHGLQMCSAMAQYWTVRALLREGREHLKRMLGLPGTAASVERVRALRALGAFAWRAGDLQQAHDRLADSLRIARQIDERREAARTLCLAGAVAAERGDRADAYAAFTEGVGLSQAVADGGTVAAAFNGLGRLLREDGQFAEARRVLDEGLVQARTLGDRALIARLCNELGRAAMMAGDVLQAGPLFQEAAMLRRALDDRLGEAVSLSDLGLARGSEGQVRGGIALVRESLRIMQRLHAAAAELAWALECFSRLAARNGEPERALRLAGAAVAVYVEAGARAGKAEQAALARHLADCRVAVGPERGRAEFTAGRALTAVQAVAAALAEELESPSAEPGPTLQST